MGNVKKQDGKIFYAAVTIEINLQWQFWRLKFLHS
jgi:hypothetical protein